MTDEQMLDQIADEADIYFIMYRLGLFWFEGLTVMERNLLRAYFKRRKSFEEIGKELSMTKYEAVGMFHQCKNKFREAGRATGIQYAKFLRLEAENKILQEKIEELNRVIEEGGSSK